METEKKNVIPEAVDPAQVPKHTLYTDVRFRRSESEPLAPTNTAQQKSRKLYTVQCAADTG